MWKYIFIYNIINFIEKAEKNKHIINKQNQKTIFIFRILKHPEMQ